MTGHGASDTKPTRWRKVPFRRALAAKERNDSHIRCAPNGLGTWYMVHAVRQMLLEAAALEPDGQCALLSLAGLQTHAQKTPAHCAWARPLIHVLGGRNVYCSCM